MQEIDRAASHEWRCYRVDRNRKQGAASRSDGRFDGTAAYGRFQKDLRVDGAGRQPPAAATELQVSPGNRRIGRAERGFVRDELVGVRGRHRGRNGRERARFIMQSDEAIINGILWNKISK